MRKIAPGPRGGRHGKNLDTKTKKKERISHRSAFAEAMADKFSQMNTDFEGKNRIFDADFAEKQRNLATAIL